MLRRRWAIPLLALSATVTQIGKLAAVQPPPIRTHPQSYKSLLPKFRAVPHSSTLLVQTICCFAFTIALKNWRGAAPPSLGSKLDICLLVRVSKKNKRRVQER